MKEWYVHRNEKQDSAKYSVDEIVSMPEYPYHLLVWKEGWSTWTSPLALKEFPKLKKWFVFDTNKNEWSSKQYPIDEIFQLLNFSEEMYVCELGSEEHTQVKFLDEYLEIINKDEKEEPKEETKEVIKEKIKEEIKEDTQEKIKKKIEVKPKKNIKNKIKIIRKNDGNVVIKKESKEVNEETIQEQPKEEIEQESIKENESLKEASGLENIIGIIIIAMMIISPIIFISFMIYYYAKGF